MQDDNIIELSDSESESRPLPQESRETSLLNSELTDLSAALKAKSKLVREQGNELNKLRKENKRFKNERDLQNAEIACLQDELKNILQQLDDHTVKNLKFSLIKLNKSDDGLHGSTVEVTRHQGNVQDTFESNSLASHSPMREDVPAEAGPSQPQNSGSHVAVIKEEPEDTKEIAVVIKSEDIPDLKTLITFVKSEDGKFDIWNLEHLGLGPPVVVEERFRVGFTRAVISDVIGGSHQTTFNNWQGPSKSTKFPYKFHSMALKRSWNPYLPLVAGDHGVAFCTAARFKDGTLISGPVDVFVSKKVNEWIYFGSYEISRCGEITPHQFHLLPPPVVRCWSEGILSTVWGKEWVKETNSRLVDEAEMTGGEARLVQYTKDGLREALEDGRLVIDFTVMKCIGYRTEWFDQFLHRQAHAKAKSSKRKKASSGSKKLSAKRVKGNTKQKVVSSESDDDEDEPESSDVEYNMKARLGSDEPVTRHSARISAKRSVGTDTASSSLTVYSLD
ncbi:hypothetical protein AZE42_01887 [Rhizopogon vesiculosus]|uniref:DUF6697 domain-containing protein n=1 Tax=Rhizopogon vesiculosus TaxID=180088 RepID=A0A1J8QUB8_9AGAM|nr:hypothetical protein AZE42_01887 [Rhizopogon vesiculosus]